VENGPFCDSPKMGTGSDLAQCGDDIVKTWDKHGHDEALPFIFNIPPETMV